MAPRRSSKHLVVVSNRGPFRSVSRGPHKRIVRAAGGLVAALDPVLRSRKGVWVSAHGTDSPLVVEVNSAKAPYKVAEVSLTRSVSEGYYSGISNAVLWPLLHGMAPTARPGQAPWKSYEVANAAFIEAILEASRPSDLIWVHDFHLMLVPAGLRAARKQARIGWFCHVPWPSSDAFGILPWRKQLLEGLLGADLLGFHTERYCRSFLDCVDRYTDAKVDQVHLTAKLDGRTTRVLPSPIGVPVDELQTLASDPGVLPHVERLKRGVDGRRIILGVDRLDYTKGIPERILAFESLLKSERSADRRYVMVQVMVPSRTNVPAYAQLKDEIDRLVGDVNGRYGSTGNMPIHYFYRNLDPLSLYAHYRAADVALVTPLRDGMNLVALEYAASRVDGDGALLLSQFAGAANYLDGAYLVNPYDIDGVASTLLEALRAPKPVLRKRMQSLRRAVYKLDVHRWAGRFLSALEHGT